MSILLHELRKIWQPPLVCAIAALGVAFYLLLPAFWAQHFANGPYNEALLDLTYEWVQKYGATMEPDEFAELDAQFATEAALFEEQVKNIPELVDAGVTSYAAYRELQNDRSGGHYEIHNIVAVQTNYPTLQELDGFMEHYELFSLARYEVGYSDSDEMRAHFPEQYDRIMQLRRSSPPSLLPWFALQSTEYYASWLALWCALSAIALLSPTVVRDRLHRVTPLQRASRHGARLGRTQLAAGLLSAAALTAANIALYAVPFLANGQLALAACPLYSPINSLGFPWFDLTYGGYLLALAALAAGIGIGAGAFALALSRASDNYIAMLLKALPLFVAMGMLFALWVFAQPLYLRAVIPGTQQLAPCGMEIIAVVIVLTAALATSSLAYNPKRIQRRALRRS